MTGQIILDDGGGRAPELRQQPSPMPLAQLLRRQLIPILRRVKPEVRAQPAHITTAVGGQVPKAVRCLLPAPLLPRLVREVIFDDGDGRAFELQQEAPAMVL